MKRYETIVIIDPDLSKEAEAPIFERVNDLIPQYNSDDCENWVGPHAGYCWMAKFYGSTDLAEEAAALTQYGVSPRYPTFLKEENIEDAQSALRSAERIHEATRTAMGERH